jgi:D-aminoacyl-tRNA deacylase
MRVVVQRVSEASVSIQNKTHSAIGMGLLILLGVEEGDTHTDADKLVRKLAALRIFNDAEGKMNLSVKDTNGQILVVSQFTLLADTQKGNRPSFIRSAKPNEAIPLYTYFVQALQKEIEPEIRTGEFGADMKISLINDGPVTIVIDSRVNF